MVDIRNGSFMFMPGALVALFVTVQSVVFMIRNWKLSIAPLALMTGLYLAMPSLPVGILIPCGALVSIGVARILYRKKPL